jgi:hypothetical protein
MVKIAYILLCHKGPDAVIEQAQRLTAAGDCVAIHFDRNASKSDFAQIKGALATNANVAFAKKQVRCGWGQWSLVQATLHALQAALEQFPRATHFYMLSGDCMPIKSAEHTHAFLENHDFDFIECFDFFQGDWIKTGMKEDRLIYRHFFNERKSKRLFYASLNAQRYLGLKRDIPNDLQMCIGSQWWCLRRQTVERIVQMTRDRRDVMRFFRTTWIPDETFFQTLVRHLVPTAQIETQTLTFLMFTDYGMPVTFYNDHYDLLLGQEHLFARKISPEANDLKQRLGHIYAAKGLEFRMSNEGRSLFKFLTGSGRIGRRFAMRFWETESTLGRNRELMLIVCKKWHVAKRILERVRQATNVPALEYVFNEEAAALPDLGGIQSSLEKRTRHRRALMRMLFDFYETDRMIVCMDPANIDLLKDFASDRSVTRILEIECRLTDQYLTGHAKRVGLAGDQTPTETIERLLPTIRSEMMSELDHIRDAGFANHHQMSEGASIEKNAHALTQFLSIAPGAARDIAASDFLFAD